MLSNIFNSMSYLRTASTLWFSDVHASERLLYIFSACFLFYFVIWQLYIFKLLLYNTNIHCSVWSAIILLRFYSTPIFNSSPIRASCFADYAFYVISTLSSAYLRWFNGSPFMFTLAYCHSAKYFTLDPLFEISYSK